jgi:hypothetical protein
MPLLPYARRSRLVGVGRTHPPRSARQRAFRCRGHAANLRYRSPRFKTVEEREPAGSRRACGIPKRHAPDATWAGETEAIVGWDTSTLDEGATAGPTWTGYLTRTKRVRGLQTGHRAGGGARRKRSAATPGALASAQEILSRSELSMTSTGSTAASSSAQTATAQSPRPAA